MAVKEDWGGTVASGDGRECTREGTGEKYADGERTKNTDQEHRAS